jgi:hypothetical protein
MLLDFPRFVLRIPRMTHPTGIDWIHVVFVTGTSADHLPVTLRQTLLKGPCGHRRIDASTEIEYPLDVPLLCVETRQTDQGDLL